MASKEYGKVIRTYRGKGKLRRTNGDEFPCHITIQQVETGLIYITCKFAPKVAQAAATIQFIMDSPRQDVELIYGKIRDGMDFESRGELFIAHSEVAVFASPNRPAITTLLAQEVDLWKEKQCHTGCYRFSVVNFEFTGNHPVKRIIQDGPKQVEHFYRNLELKTPWGIAAVDPVPDYDDLIKRTKAQKGISVTCKVVAKPSVDMELREVTSKLDELCRLLSLARGTKITWINAEECMEDGKAHRIILKNSVTWPFSPLALIDPRNPQDTPLFIGKVYPTYLKLRDSYNLDIAIELYLDAKRETAYLQTRALAAVVLLDFLQGKYASRHGLNKIVSGFSKEKGKFRDYLKKLIMSLFPDIKDEDLNEMLEKTSELNRRSYLNILKLWAHDLKLDISEDELSEVKSTRNALVHSAKFKSDDSKGKQREYFRLIRLIDQVFLKLLGYKGYFMDVDLSTLQFERHMLSHDASTNRQNNGCG